MGSILLDCNGNGIDVFLSDKLARVPRILGVSGDPDTIPRVGEEHQAQLPQIMSKFERLQLSKSPFDFKDTVDNSHSFLLGLPVPIQWIHDDSADGTMYGESKLHENIYARQEKTSKINAEAESINCVSYTPRKSKAVPGSSTRHWSDADKNSFILAFHIFEKKFVTLKKFVDNKEMIDILSYYYGQFYKSDRHCKWSDYKKKKRKRNYIYGEKIFTRWRQQELFSRLDPHVSKDLRDTFLEVFMEYKEEKLSLEEFVFRLKEIVGIKLLVEAVGIGNEHKDLTVLATEPVKSNTSFPPCPLFKACSSLTSSEIITILTGGFRLRKGHYNDIFWNAVWPRLKGRGWCCARPENQCNTVDSKHGLVFMVPGVKSFSRRGLVKGRDYFDSITDLLTEVTSKPKLLEYGAEESRVRSCFSEKDRYIQQTHHYLTPQVSSHNLNGKNIAVESGSINATNMHTSLSSTGGIWKSSLNENELRAVGPLLNREHGVDEDVDHVGVRDGSVLNRTKISGHASSRAKEPVSTGTEFLVTSHRMSSSINVGFPGSIDEEMLEAAEGIHKAYIVRTCDLNQNPETLSSSGASELTDNLLGHASSSNDHNAIKTINRQSNRRVKPDCSEHLYSMVKRQRITTHCEAEISNVISNTFDDSVTERQSQSESVEGVAVPNCSGTKMEDQAGFWLDLNLPPDQSRPENGEMEMMDLDQTQPLFDLNLPPVPIISDSDKHSHGSSLLSIDLNLAPDDLDFDLT